MVIKTENINTISLNHIDPDHMGLMVYHIKDDYDCLQHFHLPNRRRFYTVIYLTSGIVRLNMDNYNCHMQRHQVMFFCPSTVLSLLSEHDQQEGWIVLFDEHFFTQRYNDNVLHHFSFLKMQTLQPQSVDVQQQIGWSMILETMHREFQVRHPDAKNILRSYLNIFLGTLSRHMHTEMTPIPKNEKEEKVISFEKLLGEQYATHRFPSWYADQLFISTNYLNRLCQERRGMSAGQLIRERVLREAERLLIHTYKHVSEISFELGFENVSYFITFFKKKYGVSPEEFRKIQ
ncbi:helix-turn-helix domain-containing protein [Sphingobacterium faecium]|uniref:AraC family transcriptional regulator n=1 Tax=Sphingobacterium faecium TaxID=34087 RepID=UPI00320964E5